MYEEKMNWQQYYDFAAREEERRDMEYLKRLYPEQLRQLQEEIEEYCDKLEYDGSIMFDEYPDRLMLHMICKEVSAKSKNDYNQAWLDDVVPVFLYNEMYRRRSRRRQQRRFWRGTF